MSLSARNKKDALVCLAAGSATAFLSFIYFIFRSQGFFTVFADFNAQQIPFTMALHNAVREAVNGWSWSNDLGVSTVQGYGFYALGSPFFWITLLFPSVSFPYLVGWIYMLKYITASMTAYVYLCRFLKNHRIAAAAAILYAFSGFQTTNLMYYHFHDVVAFFPLLLWGLEIQLADRRRKIPFILTVGLNALVNYYFFVQEVLFLLLYFLFRAGSLKGSVWLRQAASCLVCGIWGCLLAGVLLFPSAYYILTNPRSSTQIYLSELFWGGDYFLNTIKGFLLPGEAQNDQAAVIGEIWNSADCYLPMVGLVPALAYCAKKRSWLSGLLILLGLVSLSPLLVSGFLLFTDITYRWWFMLTLMMALASGLVLEEAGDYDLKGPALTTAAVICCFALLVWFLPWSEGSAPRVYHPARFLLYTAVSLAGIPLTLFLARQSKRMERFLLPCVCAFGVLTTGLTLHYYRASSEDSKTVSESILLGARLETIDDQYRYRLTSNTLSLPGGASGMSVFSSTRSAGSMEFDALFDHESRIYSLNKTEIPGLPELFGAGFLVVTDPGDAVPVREYPGRGRTFFVTRAPACPIGFAVTDYILEEDLRALPREERGIALLSAAVIRPEDEARVALLAKRLDGGALLAGESIPALADRAAAGAVTGFQRYGRGFRCITDYPRETLVYFSVPFDPGWTARIDGAPAEILDSGGMMLLAVGAGHHDVSFVYSAPGFKTGSLVSLIALGLLLGYVPLEMRRRKKTGPETSLA